MSTYIEKLNDLVNTLKAATTRGSYGVGAGPLAGNATVSAVLRQISSLTTTPLEGFGDTEIYLATYGVQTEQDGTFSLDSEKFAAAYAADSAGYRAIFASLSQSSDSSIAITTSNSADPPVGAYTFVYTDSSTATLDGTSLIASTKDDSNIFYAISGDFAGVSIDITDASTGTS